MKHHGTDGRIWFGAMSGKADSFYAGVNAAADGKCFVRGCGRNGWWMPVLLVWAKGYDKQKYPPATIEMGFTLCKQHRREFRLNEMIDAAGWQRIVDVFLAAGRAEPDRDSIEVRWKKIHGAG